MKKYRLKKEAVQFFDKKYATAIHDFDYWTEKLCVDKVALEEVEDAYLSYGIQTSKTASSLCGWSNPETNDKDYGSHFCFTIHFPSVKYREHDEFSNGKVVRKLMDRIQRDINDFYSEFSNGKETDQGREA